MLLESITSAVSDKVVPELTSEILNIKLGFTVYAVPNCTSLYSDVEPVLNKPLGAAVLYIGSTYEALTGIPKVLSLVDVTLIGYLIFDLFF